MNIEVPRKKLDLSSAIAEGDIRVLLMVLVHMTGDERWLQPPYKPQRDVRLIPDPEAGVPKEIQDEIRAAVLKLFADGEPRPAITDPGDELMLKMMRACLGENVAPEYAPLMREEMGFIPRDARWTRRPSGDALMKQHVVIVGAGDCAIALGVALVRDQTSLDFDAGNRQWRGRFRVDGPGHRNRPAQRPITGSFQRRRRFFRLDVSLRAVVGRYQAGRQTRGCDRHRRHRDAARAFHCRSHGFRHGVSKVGAMVAPGRGLFRSHQRRRAMAARAPAVLRAMVSLQHVLALWRRATAFPAQGSELAVSRSRRQQGQ